MTPSNDAIVGIISIILGFLFGEISARLREAQTIRRQALTTRAMLRYEMTHDLERLRLLWQQVNPKGSIAQDESQALYFAEELAERPFTPLGRDVFTSQIPNFSTALSPGEVTTTLALYDDFNQLDAIHQSLSQLQREQRAYTSGAILPTPQTPPRLMPAMPFRAQAPDLWKTYQTTILRCLGQKSPVS